VVSATSSVPSGVADRRGRTGTYQGCAGLILTYTPVTAGSSWLDGAVHHVAVLTGARDELISRHHQSFDQHNNEAPLPREGGLVALAIARRGDYLCWNGLLVLRPSPLFRNRRPQPALTPLATVI
jgi:hypothetical protein